MLTPITAVRPLSPPATRVPPEISMVVSACTASFPAFMETVPPSMATSPFEDFRPSPSASILSTAVSFTVTEVLPFTAFVLSVALRVSIFTVPLVNLMSLLQTRAFCVFAVIVSTPVPFSPPLNVISSLASITAAPSQSPA